MTNTGKCAAINPIMFDGELRRCIRNDGHDGPHKSHSVKDGPYGVFFIASQELQPMSPSDGGWLGSLQGFHRGIAKLGMSDNEIERTKAVIEANDFPPIKNTTAEANKEHVRMMDILMRTIERLQLELVFSRTRLYPLKTKGLISYD